MLAYFSRTCIRTYVLKRTVFGLAAPYEPPRDIDDLVKKPQDPEPERNEPPTPEDWEASRKQRRTEWKRRQGVRTSSCTCSLCRQGVISIHT